MRDRIALAGLIGRRPHRVEIEPGVIALEGVKVEQLPRSAADTGEGAVVLPEARGLTGGGGIPVRTGQRGCAAQVPPDQAADFGIPRHIANCVSPRNRAGIAADQSTDDVVASNRASSISIADRAAALRSIQHPDQSAHAVRSARTEYGARCVGQRNRAIFVADQPARASPYPCRHTAGGV